MKNNMIKILAMRAKNRMMNKGNNYDAKIKVISNDDSDFVERVRKILDDEECSRNPLKFLMDDKRTSKMDEQNKERYLLETMDKYLKAKAQIEKDYLISSRVL